MCIERKDDDMQTKDRFGAPSTTTITLAGEGMTTMCSEIDFRMRRLEAEAYRERLAGPRDGLRQRLGHAHMALGRAIHGIETENATRPELAAR
jgi:hypothetical protein